MAATSKFFENFFTFANAKLDAFTTMAVVDIAAAVRPVAASLLGIYVVLYGISIAYGKIQEPVADSIFKLIRIAVIFALAFNLAYYNIYVADIARGAPDSIAKVLATSDDVEDESTALNAIDNAFNAGWEAGTKYYDEAGIIDGEFGYYIVAVLVWGSTLLLCLYSAFLFLLAKIAIAVLLAVGPIFIVMTLFDQTKRFFESWTAQLLNYMLLQIITAGILGLTISLFTATAQSAAAAELGMDQCLFMVVIALLTTLVIQQAPQIASGLAGGASLGTQGGFGLVMGAARRAGVAGFNRTPLGRNLEASRAARASARNQVALRTGAAINKQKFDRPGDAAGAGISRVAEQRANQQTRPIRTAATSGIERINRLRARL